jgi:hypothetical protein
LNFRNETSLEANPCVPKPWSDHGKASEKNHDFNTYGWPAWHPTRTLQEWEKARALWVSYVFREPGRNVDRPVISHSKRKNKKQSNKFEKSKKFFVQ